MLDGRTITPSRVQRKTEIVLVPPITLVPTTTEPSAETSRAVLCVAPKRPRGVNDACACAGVAFANRIATTAHETKRLDIAHRKELGPDLRDNLDFG
jgi:hypothetical protein